MQTNPYGRLSILSKDLERDLESTFVSGRLVIGRNDDCDIQLNVSGVANRHAVILLDENNRACIRPRRQVILNGVPLENDQTVRLRDKDVFDICGRSFRWEYPKNVSQTNSKRPLSLKNDNEQNIVSSINPPTPKKAEPSSQTTPKKKRRSVRRTIELTPQQPPIPALIEQPTPSIPTTEELQPSLAVTKEPVLEASNAVQEEREPTSDNTDSIQVVPSPQEEYERLKSELEATYRRRELELQAQVSDLQQQVQKLTRRQVTISVPSQTEHSTTHDAECNTEDVATKTLTHQTEIEEIKEQLLSWMTVSLKLERLFRGEAVQIVDKEELWTEITQQGIKFELWPSMILRKLMPEEKTQ